MIPAECLRQEMVYSPEFAYKEKEQRPSIGVVTIIYQPSDKTFLTIKEKKGKATTSKKAGEISFLAETRKNNEGCHRNILGSLAEGFDDVHVREMRLGLHLERYYSHAIALDGEEDLPVDVAFFMYDGPPIMPCPTAKDEVEAYGWVDIDTLDKLPMRSVAKQVIQTMKEKDWIAEIENTYLINKLVAQELQRDFFSLEQLYFQREQSKDVMIERTCFPG